ncbi:MAG: hypothetical protein LBO71_07035 [Prevotellaceae bacterium]|nr:hypothetical protein [Prevotellaceae bacterium]
MKTYKDIHVGKNYKRDRLLHEYYKNRPIERTILTILGYALIPLTVLFWHLITKNSPPIPMVG